jgi:tetratricopeptide (TPR) repeat protein
LQLDPRQAAGRVRTSAIRGELTAALDDWAWKRSLIGGSAGPSQYRLFDVASAADPDIARNEVRRAMMRWDREALAQLAAPETLDKLPLQTLSLLGGSLHNAGGSQEALVVLRFAQQAHPDDFNINFQLAWALDHTKGTSPSRDEVVRFYTAAHALRPRNPAACVCLAHALRRHGRPDEAVKLYREASELAGSDAVAQLDLGRAFMSVGDMNSAITPLRRAVRLADDDPGSAAHRIEALGYLASALDHAGRGAEAATAYDSLLQESPHLASAQNALAWILVMNPSPAIRNPRRAVALAKRAVGRVPKKAAYWNTLGVAHFRAGDWNAAKDALHESMRIRNGGDSLDWFFLAMAEWQLGQKDQARDWFDKSVKWMEKHKPRDSELDRMRTEAAALMGKAPAPPRGSGDSRREND